jgi:hypothetical protein
VGFLGRRRSGALTVPEAPSGEVTSPLQNWAKGDTKALDDLIPLVHQELQGLAHRHLRGVIAARVMRQILSIPP